MRDLLAVNLRSVGKRGLQGLTDDWVELRRRVAYWFDEHGDVVEGRDSVSHDILHAFKRVLSLHSAFHEVRIHAARNRGVDEGSPGDHSFDGEGYPGQVQVATDDLLTHNLDHLLADRTDLVHLRLVPADLAPLRVGQVMSMLLIIREESILTPGVLEGSDELLGFFGSGRDEILEVLIIIKEL